ncbi:MAG TPA: tetratricopeptide repeat protein [Caldimonas sp.]|nr:tetratricopeptide repeat protein [Caldimonas sp.]
MSGIDDRGCLVSGAAPGALAAFERALAAWQGWREGAEAPLALALREAPGFVMAHVLQAYLLVCSRDPRRVAMARPVLERAASLPANARERLHLAAIAAVLDDDDLDAARAVLGALLRVEPRDALALQAVHSLDYVSGDVVCMQARVAAVLPAWSNELPGYHAVLAMHAFGLEESGRYDDAEASARAALALDPADARAHHVMAHVFEMTGRAEAGERWLDAHVDAWATDTVVAMHCWWHMGLFQLALGRPARALDLYDRRIRAGRSDAVADLIDASALLWRIDLGGSDTGARWVELADAWAPHLDDGYCSFNDLHAMLAFVGARHWRRVDRLERALALRHALPTRHGATTRLLGLSACRALAAFGRRDDLRAITLLASLPAQAHRLGGSHAQRDVLQLTMQRAVARLGASGRQAMRARRAACAHV